jgi:hypothetical protein
MVRLVLSSSIRPGILPRHRPRVRITAAIAYGGLGVACLGGSFLGAYSLLSDVVDMPRSDIRLARIENWPEIKDGVPERVREALPTPPAAPVSAGLLHPAPARNPAPTFEPAPAAPPATPVISASPALPSQPVANQQTTGAISRADSPIVTQAVEAAKPTAEPSSPPVAAPAKPKRVEPEAREAGARAPSPARAERPRSAERKPAESREQRAANAQTKRTTSTSAKAQPGRASVASAAPAEEAAAAPADNRTRVFGIPLPSLF